MRVFRDKPITITDLLQVWQCSRSVLFVVFRNARDNSPMEFLTEQRLQHARELLLEPDAHSSVTIVALESGFTHPSRFTGIYRRRFGENPSQGLRRGRGFPFPA